jgi:hypothetical protein
MGIQFIQYTRLYHVHPVLIWARILVVKWLNLGEQNKLAHESVLWLISLYYNREGQQALPIPDIVRVRMKLLRVTSWWADKHKVLAVAPAPKQLLGEGDSVYQLMAFEAGMAYSNSPKEGNLTITIRRRLHLQALDQKLCLSTSNVRVRYKQ